jgi:MFS family permease
MLISGWALDRFGTPRLMPFFQLPMVLAFVAFGMTTSISGALIGFFFMALTTGANSTLPNAFWAEFYGTQNIGSIKAMAAAVMVFGSAIGPGVTGVLIDLGMGWDTQMVAIAAYFVLTTVMMTVGITRYKTALIA